MRVFLSVLVVFAVLVPIHSCFGPFNPDDPGMGILQSNDTSGTNPKTPATMIAWWKCDDTTSFVNSASYNGIDGKIEDGVSFDTGVGGTGYSLLFDKDTYVNVYDDTALNFKSENFTISLWCKPAQSNDPSIIISKGTQDSSLTSFILELSGNYPAVKVRGVIQKISDTLQLGTWNHIVFTRGNGAMALYLNAKKYPIGSESAYISNVKPLRIGASYENKDYYRGNIDEIKIERKAWTENEIRTEYDRFRK